VPLPKSKPKHLSTIDIERRRAEIADLYIQGRKQYDIAQLYGVSQQQISLDLKAIRAQWLESAVRDFDHMRSEQLAKIDAVEAEYWRAWEKSRAEDEAGNPQFLTGVERCVQQRCKLFGLDAPQRAEIAHVGATFILPENVNPEGTEFG
jgi:hypothetical protein